MEDQNGFLVLAQITIGAYVCYFEYIMYMMMMTNDSPNKLRKNRQSVIMRRISQFIDFIKVVLNLKHNLLSF